MTKRYDLDVPFSKAIKPQVEALVWTMRTSYFEGKNWNAVAEK
jgi:hypothetical protein